MIDRFKVVCIKSKRRDLVEKALEGGIIEEEDAREWIQAMKEGVIPEEDYTDDPDELYKSLKFLNEKNKALEVLEDYSNRIENKMSYEKFKDDIGELVGKLSGSLGEGVSSDVVWLKEATVKGFEKPLKKIGLEAFDSEYSGLDVGEIMVIGGYVSMGKTQILVNSFFRTIMNREVKAVFVSCEQSTTEIVRRIGGLLTGKMPGEIRKEGKTIFLGQYMENYPGDGYVMYSRSMVEIEKLVGELKPDIVYIDGLYLLGSGQRAIWERVKDVMEWLNNMAKEKGIAIVATTQLSRSSVAEGAEMWHLAYSSEIERQSDFVLILYRDEDLIDEGKLMVKVSKVREGEVKVFKVDWDGLFKIEGDTGYVEVQEEDIPF